MSFRNVERCRCCGAGQLDPVLDLGAVPLANALVKPGDEGKAQLHFPLAVVRCPVCTHVGLSVVVDPNVMFQDYPYLTGTSPGMSAHYRALAQLVEQDVMKPGDLVVELGSNDGTLLTGFSKAVQVLGVEPATNIAALANQNGVRTLNAFFSEETAKKVRADYGAAKVVLGNNVIAHIDDLDGVARGLAHVLADDGVFVFEVPHLLPMIERVEFDTVYHEHLSYFSVRALQTWLSRFGFTVFRVDRLPVHGGTIRTWAGRGRAVDASVAAVLDAERAAGLHETRAYTRFAERVAFVRAELPRLLDARRAQGRRVAAYGAAAKGSTLLSTSGVREDRLAYVIDRNPLKQGMCMPGTALRIFGPDKLTQDPVDDVVVLAWNLFDEIRAQLSAHEQRGGKFILPVPEPKVVP